MSNTINFKFRRKRIIKTFKSTGSGVNDCMRPSRGAASEDLAELHAEKMRIKKSKGRRFVTAMATAVDAAVADGTFKQRMMNFSRHPKGVKRERAPEYS